jgi:hypothetical protein
LHIADKFRFRALAEDRGVSLAIAGFVHARLAELTVAEPDQVGIHAAALQHGGRAYAGFAASGEALKLALVFNLWGISWGLDSGGQIWRIEWGRDFGDPCPVSLEHDPGRRAVALYQGSLRYPELEPLVPSRPDDAIACPGCAYGGDIPSEQIELLRQCGRDADALLCSCGGLGWLPRGTCITGIELS